ncbi:MAG: efflux RND transporter periplasmic adaptor subunit [Thermodesulfobacteriota bacterium]|nr:efflux RND transporter periplasmic adaptor subunit [Thermodesulfobacteriota bacterium]
MKKISSWTLAVIIAAVLIISAALLIHQRKAQLADQPTPVSRSIPVYVKSARWGKLAVTQHYLGTITPAAEAVLSAQTTGYLTTLYKDTGDRVQKGEIVAEIDMRLSAARKGALAADLAGARENLAIKSTMRNRRRELIRDRAVSQEALDESELAVSLAESRVRRLEQELAAAAVSLSFSRLESLFDGVITQRMKDAGDLVTTGTPVFRVEDPARGYKILVHVPQETGAVIGQDAPARLTHADQTIETVIDRVHPAIVAGSLATAEIKSPARPFGLPSYGIVGVDVTVAEPEGWLVDQDCILETDDKTVLFVLEDDMTVSPVDVTVLGRSGSTAAVAGSLMAGASLAAGPESLLMGLGPGTQVLPVSGGAP